MPISPTPLYPGAIRGLTFTVNKTAEFKTLPQKAPNGYSLRVSQMKNPIWHFTLMYGYVYDNYLSPNNIQPYGPYTDLQTLLGFFLQARGQAGEFLFQDPGDFCAGGFRSNVWRQTWTYAPGTVLIDRYGYAHLTTLGGTSGPWYPDFSRIVSNTTTDGTITWVCKGYFPDGWTDAPATLPLVTDALGNYYSPLQRDVGGLYQEDITDLVPGTLQVFSGGAPVQGYTIGGPGLALPGASYMGLYLQWAAPPAPPITVNFQFYFRCHFEEDTQDFEKWANGLYAIGGDHAQNGSGYLKLESVRTAVV